MGSKHAYKAMEVAEAALRRADGLEGAMTADVGVGAALAAADIFSTADLSRAEAKAAMAKAVDIIYSYREQVVEPQAKAASELGEALASGDAARIGEAVKGMMGAMEQAGKALRKPTLKHDAKELEEAARKADALADEIVAKVAAQDEDDEEGA